MVSVFSMLFKQQKLNWRRSYFHWREHKPYDYDSVLDFFQWCVLCVFLFTHIIATTCVLHEFCYFWLHKLVDSHIHLYECVFILVLATFFSPLIELLLYVYICLSWILNTKAYGIRTFIQFQLILRYLDHLFYQYCAIEWWRIQRMLFCKQKSFRKTL